MKKQNKIKATQYRRSIQLRLKQTDEETRIFPAAISSNIIVNRWYGTEKLEHTDKAINMERADEGLSLLFNHDPDKLIGKADNIRLEDGTLRGDLTLSDNTLATELYKDITGDFLRGVSLGYSIDKYKDVKGGIVATRWTPYEVSLVTIPADSSVGINRNLAEEDQMKLDENGNPIEERSVVDQVADQQKLGIEAGMKKEQERATAIRAAFVSFSDNEKAVELMERCLADYRISPDAARSSLLELISSGFEPIVKPADEVTRTQVTADETDKYNYAVTNAICVRGAAEDDPKKVTEARESGLMSLSLLEIARNMAQKSGTYNAKGDNMSMLGSMFVRAGGHSTSDFPSLLADVAHKQMAKGYELAPTNWRTWCSVGSVSDFKKANFTTLSEFSDLELKGEGAEYKHGTLKDKHEQVWVNTWAKGFNITREAIINDDLGALLQIPMKMGQAGARLLDSLAYSTLASNPTLLEDNTAVFAAGHNNVGTPGAISETTVAELMTLMRTQRGLLNAAGASKKKQSTQVLNIAPRYFIVPIALELAAKRIMFAEFSTDDISMPNMVRNALEVVSSAHLDSFSSTAFYCMASPSVTDTVQVTFLNGQQSPTLESRNGWNVDGIEYHTRLDCGAHWLDYRGATYNAGA